VREQLDLFPSLAPPPAAPVVAAIAVVAPAPTPATVLRSTVVDVEVLLEQLAAAPAEVLDLAGDLARRTLPDEDRTWLHVAADVARAEGVTLEELPVAPPSQVRRAG
jgi:hypothetical protein